MTPLTEQFNKGFCDRCEAVLAESPYVGGDHDPIAECPNCGKHFGCSACYRQARRAEGAA